MISKITASDDKNKKLQININSDQNLAKTDEYIAETRVLNLFDTDNRKGVLSKKEREDYKTFIRSNEYYINIFDKQGKKIRYIEDIGNNKYLVYDYNNKGQRTTATVFNSVTGLEERSDFIFDENGNEIGMINSQNRSEAQTVSIEYTKDNKPQKITQTFYYYDENNQPIKGKMVITKIDENGNIIDCKEKEIKINKKLNVKS